MFVSVNGTSPSYGTAETCHRGRRYDLHVAEGSQQGVRNGQQPTSLDTDRG
jgi:hypothetical protein